MTFDEYVATTGASLLRLAYVLTGDSHMAEDLAQTALADTYRHGRQVAEADEPHAYVRRVLVDAHLGWRRRRSSTERVTDLRADIDTSAATELDIGTPRYSSTPMLSRPETRSSTCSPLCPRGPVLHLCRAITPTWTTRRSPSRWA